MLLLTSGETCNLFLTTTNNYCEKGTDIDLANLLIESLQRHMNELDQLQRPTETYLALQGKQKIADKGFSHRR